ncbi:hypothetical protein GOP47_0009740 [Adiantum capillus-veneris]|uniref:Protein kinase domain-containing protein n=1 Tax=Adiantum capillus-veneris TaxID=13818 RepID=A0A9D4UX63_ADICA|nr:hypothetical protein GOP47_0009740 [Adiantum capillus-veneris]
MLPTLHQLLSALSCYAFAEKARRAVEAVLPHGCRFLLMEATHTLLYFTFSEILEMTSNFDEGRVVGVGGFGKVYKGVLEDGTSVAVKRGNPTSEQGVTEFQTEIELLSKLRHRHLVSLIGFCEDHSEMILVS